MRVRAQHSDHAAEAVKEWDRHAYLVARSQREPLSKPVSVVDYVPICEHHALRESGRPRRVLHVYHGVEALCSDARVQLRVTRPFRAVEQRIVTSHSVGMFVPDVNHITQEGQLRRAQRSLFGPAQLWDYLVNRFHIINIAKACDSYDGAALGLLEQEFDFSSAKARVDGNEHRSDLC